MIAIVGRPENWEFPLFLHVLGAIVLVGAVAATLALAVSSQRWRWLRPLTLRTMLAIVIPAWLLMRLAGQWEDSKSSIGDGRGWLDVGYFVGDAGVLFLILASIFAWLGSRNRERRWPGQAVAVLAAIYLAALLVAMFAMSGKPGA
jgi:NADH:ubiquinone oxidoreductase subunit 6 (subunit J)